MDDQMTRDAGKNRDMGAGGGGSGDAGTRSEGGDSTVDQAMSMARSVGEQARSMASGAGQTAQDLARRAREQASGMSDTLYEQGSRAGEYLTRNVNEYPFAALLVAGAIGYGLAFLVHTNWQSDWMGWQDGNDERQGRHRDNKNEHRGNDHNRGHDNRNRRD